MAKKLTQEQIKKEITRRNKLFQGKTRDEKRVLIAKDVLAQIKMQRINPKSGPFVHVQRQHAGKFFREVSSNNHEEVGVRERLLSSGATCNCCALGAMMVSCTLFNNKETINNFRSHFEYLGDEVFKFEDKLPNGFNTIFSKNQLRLIETAFEGGSGYNVSLDLKIQNFKTDNPDASKRLQVIMENIIRNNGTFKI